MVEHVEEKALRSFGKKPGFWQCFTDDTLTVVQKDMLEDFHGHLNSVEHSIKFTVEIEADGQLPFLDVLVIRNDDESTDRTVYLISNFSRIILNVERFLLFPEFCRHIRQWRPV